MHISYSSIEVRKTNKKIVNSLETTKLLGLKIKNNKTKEKRLETEFISFCKHIQILGCTKSELGSKEGVNECPLETIKKKKI